MSKIKALSYIVKDIATSKDKILTDINTKEKDISNIGEDSNPRFLYFGVVYCVWGGINIILSDALKQKLKINSFMEVDESPSLADIVELNRAEA